AFAVKSPRADPLLQRIPADNLPALQGDVLAALHRDIAAEEIAAARPVILALDGQAGGFVLLLPFAHPPRELGELFLGSGLCPEAMPAKTKVREAAIVSGFMRVCVYVLVFLLEGGQSISGGRARSRSAAFGRQHGTRFRIMPEPSATRRSAQIENPFPATLPN